MNFSHAMELFCGEKLTVFDATVPAFSDCFSTLVFTVLPFTSLVLTSAYFIGRLKIPDLNIKTPWRIFSRLICTFVTFAFTVTNNFITIFPRNAGQGYVTVSLLMCAFGLLVHFLYLLRLSKVHFIYKRGPLIVTISWLLTLPYFVVNTEYLLAKVIKLDSVDYLVKIQAAFAAFACVSHLFYLLCIIIPNARYRAVSVVESEDAISVEKKKLIDSVSGSYYQLSSQSGGSFDRQQRCPADTANVFSKLFFCWVQPLMRKGARRLLTDEESVFDLPEDISTSVVSENLCKSLMAQNDTEQSTQHQSERNILLRAMHKTFGTIYYASGLLKLLADALAFAGPLLLNKLVNYIENFDEPLVHGYYYAIGLFLSSFIGSLLSAHFDYQVNKVKLRVKSALITNIYGKTLQAQPSELSSYTTGEITNFMSTDVDRVVNFCASFHEFWSLPFQVAITLYLLHQQVGIVFLAGVGLAVVMIMFNRYLAKKIGQYNAAMMMEKDNRVKLMTEVLLGIRVIKFNAWEYFMSEKLERIRNKELKSLKGIKYFDAGCVYLWATTPVLISLLTFSIYSVTGHDLTAAKVFTVIALINMLISPLNAFPWVVNGLMEAWVSLKRLNRFIKTKNLELEKYYDFPSEIEPDDMDVVVDMEKVNCSWSHIIQKSDDKEHAISGKDQGLNEITFRVREGQFIGVIGTVGSGKSSLLSAILAEMQKDNGRIYVDCISDGFAVVTQEPWIQHATIRDNILWGKPFNANHYQSVVDSCALAEDFRMFPDNDLTEVGENGVTLSGGQKARVALARALYQDKSLYLLDDPLSAVDQHVGSHLHDRCIIGELAAKTRILCTHHTKYLRHADAIVVMENGKIKQIGTPSEILQLSQNNHKQAKKSKSKSSLASSSTTGSTESGESSNENTRLMTEEDREVGTVAFSVYKSYWFAIGSYLAATILLFLFLMQGSKVTSDWWLSYWVTNIKSNGSSAMYFLYEANSFNVSQHRFFTLHFVQPVSLSVTSYTVLYSGLERTSDVSHDTEWYLMVYGCIAASNSLFTLFRSFLFAYGGIKAAKVMHYKLLKGVLQAPISFFDVTPVGRILNRFSSDTYTVDDSLPFILNIFLAQFVGVLGTIVITCYGLPWFAIALIPLGAFYFYIQHYYRLTSRELKRLSSVSLSPIYAHFTETLSGLTTIRAFRKHGMFRNRNFDLVTANQCCNFSTLAAQEWFGVRLQMIGVAMVTVVAFVAVFMHQSHSVSPGLAGLALSYALSVTSRLSGVITSFTETEKQMVAVERESHYINNIPKERAVRSSDLSDTEWPSIGTIEFSEVSLRYRKGLPLALKTISFKIEPGEKVGIVGRTGSGKSSLLMLLFGMIEPCAGNIYVDGTDIKHVSLEVLRSGLSIIPQDPFLFSGSIYENLVPISNDTHTENELLHVLERCNLKNKVIEMGGLYTSAGEKGKRFSVGQRQLLCLARALLTNSKIICLDEATASVDGESDVILQRIIREHFQDRTVLTIAHRIETVMDCDRVLVMDDGHVAEFGFPDNLMANSDSLFYKLACANGSNC